MIQPSIPNSKSTPVTRSPSKDQPLAPETAAATDDAILHERAMRLARRTRHVVALRETKQMLVFTVAGEAFGLNLRAIERTMPAAKTVAVCGAPPHVRGVLNTRGNVTTVIDMARLLHLQERDESATGYALVLHVPKQHLAVRADAVQHIQNMLALDQLQSLDDTALAGSVLIHGMTADGVAVLNAQELLSQCQHSSDSSKLEMETNDKSTAT